MSDKRKTTALLPTGPQLPANISKAAASKGREIIRRSQAISQRVTASLTGTNLEILRQAIAADDAEKKQKGEIAKELEQQLLSAKADTAIEALVTQHKLTWENIARLSLDHDHALLAQTAAKNLKDNWMGVQWKEDPWLVLAFKQHRKNVITALLNASNASLAILMTDGEGHSPFYYVSLYRNQQSTCDLITSYNKDLLHKTAKNADPKALTMLLANDLYYLFQDDKLGDDLKEKLTGTLIWFAQIVVEDLYYIFADEVLENDVIEENARKSLNIITSALINQKLLTGEALHTTICAGLVMYWDRNKRDYQKEDRAKVTTLRNHFIVLGLDDITIIGEALNRNCAPLAQHIFQNPYQPSVEKAAIKIEKTTLKRELQNRQFVTNLSVIDTW